MIRVVLMAALAAATAAGFDLVEYPQHEVWIKEGHDEALTCTSATPWQWCYWERTAVDADPSLDYDQGDVVDVRTVGFRTRRYQTAQGAASYGTHDKDVTFAKMSQKTCGIELKNASQEKYQGSWKCHLAHTDLLANEDIGDIKDEAIFDVHVAVEVKDLAQKLTTSVYGEGRELDKESEIMVGDTIFVSCSYGNSALANPKPLLRLYLRDAVVAENELSRIVRELEGEVPVDADLDYDVAPDDIVEFNHTVTGDDVGVSFGCETSQNDDFGEPIYRSIVDSFALEKVFQRPTVRVISPPVATEAQHFSHFGNGSLILLLQLEAIPMAKRGDVRWRIVKEASGGKIELHPGETADGFAADEMETSKGSAAVSLAIPKEVAENVVVALLVEHPYGDLEHVLPKIVFQEPARLELVAEEEEETAAGIGFGFIALIVALVTASAAVVLYMSCVTRTAVKNASYHRRLVNDDKHMANGTVVVQNHQPAFPVDFQVEKIDDDDGDQSDAAPFMHHHSLGFNQHLLNIPTAGSDADTLTISSINDTIIRVPTGHFLRISGPTNFPVLSPPPSNYSTLTNTLPTGRKHPQLHFSFPDKS